VNSVLLLSVLGNGLWQAALVALAGALTARVLKRRSAAWRHGFWCVVLATAVLLPLLGTLRRADRREEMAATRVTAGPPPITGMVPNSLPSAMLSEEEETGPASTSARVRAASATIVTPPHVSQRVVSAYLLVVGLLLCLLVYDLVRVILLKRRAAALPLQIEVQLARCRRECGVRRRLRYGTSNDIDTPVFLGLSRPALLLPFESWSALSERELQQVTAHELAHAQRRDDWLALGQRIVLTFLFFNPAIRWICARLSLEREMACDEWAVQRVPGTPTDYAGTLLRVAECAARSPHRNAMATAFSGSCLGRRISWLISGDFVAARGPARKRVAIVAVAFALAVFAIGAAPAVDFVVQGPVLGGGASTAADLKPAAIARRLDRAFDRLEQAGFNGAVLVALHDRIVLKRGFGVRDRRTRTPAEAATLFQAGAMAKMLTGAAILRLEEQGRLSVDDPLTKWLGPLPAPKDRIRLHHLLVHASGLTPAGQPVYAASEGDFIEGLRSTPAGFAPGTSQRHSDIAYSALALVVQRASGMRYEDYVRKELLEPAGLHNTWFADDAPQNDIATEYSRSGDATSAVGTRPYVWGRRGAMAVVSNVEDLYLWERALRTTLFSARQRARMYDAGVQSFWGSRTGYGWESRATSQQTIAWQRLSAWDGNSVELMRDDTSGLTVALFIDNRLDWSEPRYEAIAQIVLQGDADGSAQAHLQQRWAN
jgi:CubicO group peptidase (beta-lactamase class C family)